MRTTKYYFTALLLPLLIFSLNLKAQTNLSLSEADFTVAGTSSLHDWTMTSSTASGEAQMTYEGAALKSIPKTTVTVKAETLKSGKSGMDDNAYKALKTKNHPDITFTLKNIKSIVKKGDHYLVDAEGTLTIAGEAKTISVQAQAIPTAKTLEVTGEHSFKMTDFKIDPPTALLGTIKTGDTINIIYKLHFKSN